MFFISVFMLVSPPVQVFEISCFAVMSVGGDLVINLINYFCPTAFLGKAVKL